MQTDAVVYGAGISACEKGGEWQQALNLVAELRLGVWDAKRAKTDSQQRHVGNVDPGLINPS